MPPTTGQRMHVHPVPSGPCLALQLQRNTRRCWQLLLQYPPLVPLLEPHLIARCTRFDADRRLSRSFFRWKTAARRKHEATLRWATSGLSERLLRADPGGELLTRAFAVAESRLSESHDASDLRHLFELHRAFTDYRVERSRLVARYAHVVAQVVAESRVPLQEFEDTLHDGIVQLAAAPAAYRAGRSTSFEAFVRQWFGQQLGSRPEETAA